MKYNKKLQEGVFIGVFALATLVVISLAIGFMSNRVNDLLSNQGQMIAGKQAYWLANSGVEVIAQDKLADLGSATIPVKGAELPVLPDGTDVQTIWTQQLDIPRRSHERQRHPSS